MDENPEPMTNREHEVLALMAAGRTANEIAAELGVSVWTAKAHVASIVRKFEGRPSERHDLEMFDWPELDVRGHERN